jgi:tRNA threonylcarbamoyladenosine biosynthesis protein TsaE
MITCAFSAGGSFGTVICMNDVTVREVTKDQLDDFAGEVLAMVKEGAAKEAQVIALSGDLGAGKTTFTQALGRRLGITEDMTSPTFTIMKGYETTDDTFTHVVHMDAYRIESEEELRPLRFDEILKMPNTLLVIEWAELIKGALPADALHITLSIKDETTRTATLSRL